MHFISRYLERSQFLVTLFAIFFVRIQLLLNIVPFIGHSMQFLLKIVSFTRQVIDFLVQVDVLLDEIVFYGDFRVSSILSRFMSTRITWFESLFAPETLHELVFRAKEKARLRNLHTGATGHVLPMLYFVLQLLLGASHDLDLVPKIIVDSILTLRFRFRF